MTDRISTTLSFLPCFDNAHLDASPYKSFRVTAQAALEMVKLMMEIASKENYVGEGNLDIDLLGKC
jgi:hypothetical protein